MSDEAADWRTEDEPSETVAETIARLAGLSAADYETVRRAEAKRLDWRISRLDGEVVGARENNRLPPIWQSISPAFRCCSIAVVRRGCGLIRNAAGWWWNFSLSLA